MPVGDVPVGDVPVGDVPVALPVALMVAAESSGVVPASPPEGQEPSELPETAVGPAPDVAAVATEAAEVALEAEPYEIGEPLGDASLVDEVQGEGFAPISREDYVPAGGAGDSAIRDINPGGLSATGGTRPVRRTKTRSRPALPTLAVPPAFKTPRAKVAKPAETPAQKPDLKLTADILEQQSPLASHLQKHAEQKRKKKGGEEEAVVSDQKRSVERPGLGLIESRQQRRDRRTAARRPGTEETPARVSRARGPRRRRQRGTAPVELKTSAQIELPITLRGLSEALGRPANALLKTLFGQGQMITINDNINEETALDLAVEFGVDLEIRRSRDVEDVLTEIMEMEDTPESLTMRPPLITILGHVDHGKTSLLDKIRSANVAGGEAGGITQHIASYQVEYGGKKLTFVDTPGHAAFGEMRARGANVTDIVVLVVAADDGVMPQTIECISHAKAAGVPIVVALNKIDLPDTNQDKVLADLAAHEVVAQEWGGDVEVVRTSAQTGEGIDALLETLMLTAELNEYQANPDRPALGVCLEAFRDEGRGVLAWLVVQNGTLRIGDVVLCGAAFGRIRAIYDDRDEELSEAGPSKPVRVAGLDEVPGAGEHFFVLADVENAREAAEARRDRGRAAALVGRGRPRTLDDILNAARGGAIQDLSLILKADTPGSLEALRGEIEKLEHPEVRAGILHEGVGGVNESDVYLASASGAIIVAFHVIPEDRALAAAEKEQVEIRRYNIIYEVTAHIKRVLEGLLEPERVEVRTGRALVLQRFSISRVGTAAGCRVLTGTIDRSNRVHVIRDQKVLNDYRIASLRRERDDAKEVREGMECGIRLDGFNDVKEGDLLEAFRIEEVKRTLDG